MSEYIISDEQIMSERQQAYEAGERNRKIWTARVYHGEEIVRCRDCKFSHEVEWPEWMNVPSDYLDCCGELVEAWDYYNDEPNNNPVKPDGFCAWGEKVSE